MMRQMEQLRLQGLQNQQLLLQGIYAMLQQQAVQNASLERTLLAVADRIGPASGGPPAADGMRLGWQGSIEAPLYNSSELGGGTLAEGTEGSGTQGETTQHRDPVAAPPAPESSTSLKLEPSIKPHVEEEPVTKEQAVAAEERKEGQEREVEKKEEPHVEAKGQESKAQQQEVDANIGTSEETQDVGRPTSLSQPSGWKASRFHLIGFFNNWSLDSAATRECGERFEVRRNAQKAGNGGMLREEFQILGDKSWDKRVFPAGGSGEVVVLLKPGQPEPAEQSTEQVAGHGRNWAIDGRPGTSYRVTYEPLSRTVLCEAM
ncbi:unnamed protein product [Polarella glacialis]|uniref:Uncharacterized protein n=1 Tax=Polarella glacialis TaxID=89957 RepID=A0A813FMC4_POLGL|nr:unnamed protein product [Polarella glacialis]